MVFARSIIDGMAYRNPSGTNGAYIIPQYALLALPANRYAKQKATKVSALRNPSAPRRPMIPRSANGSATATTHVGAISRNAFQLPVLKTNGQPPNCTQLSFT